MKIDVTFGADPEYFIKANQTVIPICGIMQHNYANEDGEFGADGFAIEIRPNYSHDWGELIEREDNLVNEFMDYSTNALNLSNIEMLTVPIVDVEIEQIKSGGRDAAQFGCEPDINVYNDSASLPRDASNILKQVAGGHVHVGSENPEQLAWLQNNAKPIIKAMDYYITLPLLLDDDLGGHKDEWERRKFYGGPGAMRIQQWGIEYRVLSNRVFKSNRKLIYGKIEKLFMAFEKTPAEKLIGQFNTVINELDVCDAIFGINHSKTAKLSWKIEEIVSSLT